VDTDGLRGEVMRIDSRVLGVGVIILETMSVGWEDIESTLVDDPAAYVRVREKTEVGRTRDLCLKVEWRTP